ncbi:MAG: DUF456 domain-containing protein [Candidatus Omnitrophica bacterium]|nr:DUF456 domain-containing protein [Candidatus Omnitrophota bacterium]
MELLALVILVISILAGFVAIFFTTFGTLIIMIGSLVYAAMTNFSILTIKHLIFLFTFYLCGEVLEYALIIIGAKKFGASNPAVIGALIGGILGAIIGAGFFGIGLILGAFLGIFLGAFLVELILQKDLVKSLKAGTGGVLGRAGSIIAKLLIAIVMLTIIISRVISNLAL